MNRRNFIKMLGCGSIAAVAASMISKVVGPQKIDKPLAITSNDGEWQHFTFPFRADRYPGEDDCVYELPRSDGNMTIDFYLNGRMDEFTVRNGSQ